MLNKLELTWYNKYEQKNIEPRILVENKEKSYGNTWRQFISIESTRK